MAHFAEVDENNVVLRITVVANEVLLDENNIEQESLGLEHLKHLGNKKWVQTSYNANFRARYAGIGMIYREDLDVFIFPQPYPSWILNEETYSWKSPVPYPTVEEGSDELYVWDENTISWLLLPPA